MKNNNTWTFGPTTATVNGKTYPASYSVTKTGDVYVFTGLKAADGTDLPVRIHVAKDMPVYASALKAAQESKGEPAPAQEPAAQAEPKAQDAPAPVKAPKARKPKGEPAPAQKPAAQAEPKAQDAPAPVKAPKAEPAPAQEPAAQAEPKAQDAPASVQGKAWIGTVITGNGWNIAFDATAQRTRVLFQAEPSAAQKAAIADAGFYWSNQLGSFNKKLTCKAYRAALDLAEKLRAIA